MLIFEANKKKKNFYAGRWPKYSDAKILLEKIKLLKDKHELKGYELRTA